ncbi:MAG: hypothetical protein KDA85_19580, partial [Planctomycetaceae bacterium]|nr:hypothetical protein [Planctomycetaceae bacterium]
MSPGFTFGRSNRRRSRSARFTDAVLSSIRRQFTAPVSPPRQQKRSAPIEHAESMELRLLLAATIDLSTWAGVPFLLSASGNGANATFTLTNRTNSSVLTTASVTAATGTLIVSGSTSADDLWIDTSGVTVNLPVSLSVNGLGGTDSVVFKGTSKFDATVSVIAESIGVDASVTVDAQTSISLTAVSALGTVSDTGLTASTTGTNSASLTVSGTVTAPTILLSAATSGTVNSTSTASLLTATNTWTDSAVVTINGGASITGTNVSILADRATSYSARGRNAKNEITGNASITIGQTGSGASITAGTSLSILADNRITATAVSPDIEVNLDTLAWPAAVEVAIARNQITGNTSVAITDSTISQTTGGGAGTTIEARRRLETVAEAGTDALTYNVIPNGASVALAGSYASNLLSGDVSATVSGGSVSGTKIAVTAHDQATAMVKSGLSATSV